MFGGRLKSQCGTAETGARGIVLRRVHATAQDVAIVPLQRIGARQAVIAGQRQGILDRGDGVVGHGQLDDVGLGRGKRDTVIEITGEGCDQPRIDGEPCLDRPEDLLRARQGRKRRAQASRHALLQERDQPVACSPRNAVIDRGDEDRVDGRLRDIGYALRTSISASRGTTTSSKMTSWLPLARRP